MEDRLPSGNQDVEPAVACLLDRAALIRRPKENWSAKPGSWWPKVVLTANAMAGDKDRYLAAGMDDYLAKPVDANLLFEVIERWVGLSQTMSPK